jgi:hypothetical protein
MISVTTIRHGRRATISWRQRFGRPTKPSGNADSRGRKVAVVEKWRVSAVTAPVSESPPNVH